MTKIVRRTRALLGEIWHGMDTPASVYETNTYRYLHKSEQEALRSDWNKIGNDFKVVMKRENVKAAA